MITSKTLCLTTLAVSVSSLALATAPARADDLSGLRIGVHGDYLWANVAPSGFADAGDTTLGDYDANSSGIGADVRYDWQQKDTVFGVFATFTSVDSHGGSSVDKEVTVPDDEDDTEETPNTEGSSGNTVARIVNPGVIEAEGTTITESHGFDTDLSALFGVGGRVGHVINGNTLLYAQAGLASGKIKVVETGDNATASRKVTKTGYMAGVGIDLQMNEKWSLGFTYSHYDLGKVKFTPAAYAEGELAFKGNTASLTLGYRF